MKNKSKWVFWGFFSLDYKAMEEYLEEMAEKGWMLEKVGRVIARFRAIEPRKIKFYVDVFKEGGPLTPEKTEESEEYRKLCLESGWTFITTQDYLQFFYADEDSEPIPIQTDEEIEQKIVELTLLRQELIGIFIFLIIAVFVLANNIPFRYNRLLSFTGITSTFLFPILCIFTVVPGVYSIFWMIKARRDIKNGLSIVKPTLKSARRRIIAFSGTTWVIILIYTLSFISDAFFTPDKIALALLGPAVGMFLGSGVRYLVRKNKIKKDDSKLYIVISIIFIIIFMPIVSSLLIEGTEDMYKVDSVPEGYPIITMEEISKDTMHGSEIIREFKPGMSPIVPKHYTYWEYKKLNGITKSINVKYYEAINPYFAEIIFNGIIDKLEKGIKWRGEYILTQNIITDDKMKDLWGMNNMALAEERDEIIIQKGNIVLHLIDFSEDMDFDDNQTRELIINRFFSDSSLEN